MSTRSSGLDQPKSSVVSLKSKNVSIYKKKKKNSNKTFLILNKRSCFILQIISTFQEASLHSHHSVIQHMNRD